MKILCKVCNTEKGVVQKMPYTTPLGKMTLMVLECGHGYNSNKIEYKSSDGRQLYPFQDLGVEFLNAPVRTGRGKLLADEQGLGKTPQTLCYLKDKVERLPCLIIAPAKLTGQ